MSKGVSDRYCGSWFVDSRPGLSERGLEPDIGRRSYSMRRQDIPAALVPDIHPAAVPDSLEVLVQGIPPAAGRDNPVAPVQDSLPVVDQDILLAAAQDTRLAVHKVAEAAVRSLAEELHRDAQGAVRAVRKLRLERRKEHPKLQEHQAHHRVDPLMRRWWLRSCSMLLERLGWRLWRSIRGYRCRRGYALMMH